MAQRFLSDVHATAGLKDSSGDLGSDGQVLSSTGSNTNWVNPTIGTTVIYKDFFTTQSNQTQFPLANSVDSVDKLQVYVDGVYQKKANYSVSGTTLTCTGLETGSEVEVITLSTATANNAANVIKLDNFTGGSTASNNSGKNFPLGQTPTDEKVTQVYINGVYQSKATYSITGSTLIFSTAPPDSSSIEVVSFEVITSNNGNFTATTFTGTNFLGDLNGTINTATTATTQSAGNNSTKISTTAYADAKVAEAITNGTTGIAPSQDVVFDALALKATLADPTFTGTVGGITKAMVGLTNAEDTTDLSKVISTATQDALNLKSNLAGPTFTGDTGAANLTLSGYLRGPASFVIDPAAHGNDTGTLVVAGNLQVDGTTTTINSTTVSIDDLNFSIATDAADSAAANGAGITIGGAGASLTYSHSGTKFVLNKPLDITGAGTFSGDVKVSEVNPLIFADSTSTNKASGIITSESGTSKWAIGTNFGSGDNSFNIYNYTAASRYLTISSGGDATFNSSLAGFGVTITNNNDSSQGLLVRTSDNDGGEYILDLQSSSSATGTNYASKFKVAKGGDVTLNGNGTTSALLFGQSSYARIINTSGQTLYVDSDVHEFRTSGGVGKLTISSAGAIGQAVTPLTDPYVASGEQWMTYQIGKGGIFAAYKNNNESMFGFNTYTKVTDGAHKAIISNIGGSATRYYADRITFNTLTTSGTAQTQTEVMRVLANGKVGIGTTSPIEKLQVAGQIISTGSNSTSATAGAERAIMDLSAFSSTDHSARFGHFRGTNSAGAGQLRLYTDSVERLRIDASGKVGIGTTAPAQKLHILHPSYLSTSTIQGLIRLTGQSNSENSGTIPSAGTSIEFYNKWSGGSEYSVARISGRASQGYDGGLQFDVGSNSGPGQSGFTTALSILANGVVSGDLNDTSDVSLKKDIQSLGDSTELVKKLNPVSFYWNKEHKGKNKNIGFIAQQVEEVLPELVKGDEGSKSINVTGLVSLLTKSIQEQQTIIEDLKSRIETLEG